jgi:hypothetical protein
MQVGNRCAACDAPSATKRCSVCKAVHYCDADCQHAHWLEHKRHCTPAQSGPPTLAEVEKKRTAFIEQLADGAPTTIQARWAFLQRRRVYLNGKDVGAVAGDMSYAYPFDVFEFGPAIKFRDWVFALERMTPGWRARLNPAADPSKWYVVAFHGRAHYNFGKVDDAPNLVPALLGFVMPKIAPIFYPEAFAGCAPDARGMVQVAWETGPLEKPSVPVSA